MSTGRWLRISLQRYVVTALLGGTAAASVLPLLGGDPFGESLAAGIAMVLVGVPLLTLATMFVIVLLAGRRFEPPTGGAQRIRGGWMVVLPLAPLLPIGLFAPLQGLIVLVTQLVYVVFVLPCQDSRDTADVLRSLADPAVPAEQRARTARAVGELGTRPVVEALMGAATDAEPEVAAAALETLCTIWRRDGAIGEDVLRRLPAQAQAQARALDGVEVRSPW
ncbi:HEAT repeat domain-containing protein [Streptomyces sp. NPDC006544]|uniref:HEAT repeat domain-containing protein n=1 Tax=Streptomyces sp. NPDC006544 TaxID=3154583 RepID=UPI0033AA143A